MLKLRKIKNSLICDAAIKSYWKENIKKIHIDGFLSYLVFFN
jgi:hypothetical protein